MLTSPAQILSQLLSKRITGADPVSKVIYRQFRTVALDTPLEELSKIFDHDHFALVVATQRCYSSAKNVSEKKVVCGVASRIDLLNYIMAHAPKH